MLPFFRSTNAGESAHGRRRGNGRHILVGVHPSECCSKGPSGDSLACRGRCDLRASWHGAFLYPIPGRSPMPPTTALERAIHAEL